MIEGDARYMRRAIELARRGAGWTNPNPLVGAVVVKDGCVIGEGWHERYGEKHAERNALDACSESPEGATVYVTLEPCAHTGHQPPCADALAAARVGRVVVGSRDPNPLVSGRGAARLRKAGVRVDVDFLRSECDALNPVFFHYITTKRPFVIAKWAMTADGRIAAHTGDARWVSGEASRADVHELRHRLAAIMVGVDTVIADDPLLTCRRAGGESANQPLRIVCDTQLRIPEDCALVRSAAAGEAPLLFATGEGLPADGAAARAEKLARLEVAGVRIMQLPHDEAGRVSLAALMAALGEEGIDSILLEGGSCLHASALAAGIVQRVVVYLAPKIVGGADAPGPVGGAGCGLMAEALRLGSPRIERLDDDLRLDFAVEAAEARGCDRPAGVAKEDAFEGSASESPASLAAAEAAASAATSAVSVPVVSATASVPVTLAAVNAETVVRPTKRRP